MADRAREIASEFDLSIDVLDEARMEQEGMGSLLSVSRGSDQPGKLIILNYTPSTSPKNGQLLALVGKVITFDSGGISLKPGESNYSSFMNIFVCRLQALKNIVKNPMRVISILHFMILKCLNHSLTGQPLRTV